MNIDFFTFTCLRSDYLVMITLFQGSPFHSIKLVDGFLIELYSYGIFDDYSLVDRENKPMRFFPFLSFSLFAYTMAAYGVFPENYQSYTTFDAF